MAKRNSRPARSRWAPFRWSIGFLSFAVLVTAVYLAGGAAVALARGRVAASPRGTLDCARAQITAPPVWLSVDVPARILAEEDFSGTALPLIDRTLVSRLGQAFEASPWVRSCRVRKGPGQVVVELEYRRPLLFLPWQSGATGCYVAGDGTVLPADEARDECLRDCLVVDGIDLRSPPRKGDRIDDPRIVVGAGLARLIAPEKRRLALATLQAPAGESGEWILTTRNGSRILWGDARDSLTNEEKLTRLMDYFHRTGGLDLPEGPYQFDLRAAGPVEPRPLAQPATP